VFSRRSLFAFAFSFVLAVAIQAQQAPQWRIYASEGRSIQNYHGQAGVQSISFERSNSRKTRLGLDFGVAASAHAFEQARTWLGDGHQNVPAAGLSLLARHRFAADSATAQPFVEISSGPMWATERVPAATSHFNFYSQLGVGYVIHPDRKRAWILGWRFGHISNAGYGRLNSGLNINSLMIGTQFH
jgi:hypothetical protein